MLSSPNYKKKHIKTVTEVVEVSPLGHAGSGNKFQKQKKGPWSIGERKAKAKSPREQRGGRERPGCAP